MRVVPEDMVPVVPDRVAARSDDGEVIDEMVRRWAWLATQNADLTHQSLTDVSSQREVIA